MMLLSAAQYRVSVETVVWVIGVVAVILAILIPIGIVSERRAQRKAKLRVDI